MSNTNLVTPVDEGLVKKSVREFDAIVYDFLENNKDKLCNIYSLPPYNPTELKRKYLRWCAKHNLSRLVEPVHSRPYYISRFLSGSFE